MITDELFEVLTTHIDVPLHEELNAQWALKLIAHSIRRAALEKAAKVLDDMAAEHQASIGSDYPERRHSIAVHDFEKAAIAIRALAERDAP